MVSSGWSISLNASEKPPFEIDWACNWIMGSAEVGNKNELLTQEIEAVNPEQQIVKVVFKPAVTDWKVAQLSILDPDGSAITEARATPPCHFISIRSLVKTADGDPAIVSFGPNLKKLGYETQNPPLVLSKSIIHRSSMPLRRIPVTGVFHVSYPPKHYQKKLRIENVALTEKFHPIR